MVAFDVASLGESVIAVHHHRCFARFTTQGVAACLTGTPNPRRPTSSVEQHNGLVSSLCDLVQGVHQCLAEAAVMAVFWVPSQVHHFDSRQRHSGRTRAHAMQLPTAADCFGPRFHGRRGRSQNDGALGPMGPQNGQISTVIAGGLFLFVRTLVLFIHHNQSQFAFTDRGKDSRARPQNHSGFTRTNRLPLCVTLAGVQS